MEQERRNVPRIEFRLKVMINFHPRPGKIMNFSTAGAFIQTRNPLEYRPGDEIELATKFPLEKKTSHINAQVAHVKSDGIGVRFRNVRPQDAADIEYCFNVFKNTLPLPGT
ncbi:MAG: PilZ domain-containing protein [Deltaproteobacteria bacterium]|nr:MAG: PilZ domain-containing protein [Deltaproteobacteria bacterium]